MAAVKKATISGGITERHEDLVECFRGAPAEILWNTGSRLQLVWPSWRVGDKHYFYIGRERAQALLADVLRLDRFGRMQILGAKGSGKSTVMAAIAGYLHGTGSKKVVYVSGHHYAFSAFLVLRDALLLSFCGQNEDVQEILDLKTMSELQEWCEWKSLCFVVDDWDQVAGTSESDLNRACEGNMLVMISSVNSRERYVYDTSQKAHEYLETFEFDGPFTESELQTWRAHSGLSDERLASLDQCTGGMPRLLFFFSNSKDDEEYREDIGRRVTSRAITEIVEHLTTKDAVVAALQLVTSQDGLVIPAVLEGMKLSCFYKKGRNRFCILCPYLRTIAEEAIVSKGSSLDTKLKLGDVQTWIAAVQADLRAPVGARNPARIGWNVEGLVIGVLRVQGQLLPNYSFSSCRTYARRKEVDVLSALSDETLQGGVLLVPIAFNEKAVA